jgi:predicted DNA-binding antitoxin AbrB/MazE fold protein
MNEEGDTDTLGVFKLLNKCVISITDGEEVFTRDDFSEKELDKFLEGMSIQMLDQVQEFMNSIPKLIIRHQYQCEACESNSEIELEGIASFFG